MYDLVESAFDGWLVVVGLFFLRGFGPGPRSDISRTSPSRGVKFRLLVVGKADVRFGLVPHFAMGPITDVSSPTSSSGDFLVLRVDDVNGWFYIRGTEVRDVGVTSPSSGMWGRIFWNDINAVSGRDAVSTPSSFLAERTVVRPTRGR
jgi:hypothetical protein